jgi:hypothetical protein
LTGPCSSYALAKRSEVWDGGGGVFFVLDEGPSVALRRRLRGRLRSLALWRRKRYNVVMTFAEILITVALSLGLYYLLRPFQRVVELAVLKALGRSPKWVDADVVSKKEDQKE